MSAENSSSKASLFLDSPRKWNLWYNMILGLATELQVLDLISEESPNRMSEIPEPVSPEFPIEYTMEARVKWEMENSRYNNDRNIYKEKLAGVSKIRQEIFRTVAFSELEIATNGNSHIDMKDLLIALKKRLSPRTADRQYEVRKKNQNLQKVPKQNLDQWLDAWTLIEAEIKHSGIDGNFDIWEDFFHINMTIDNPYAAIRKREVEIGGKENFSFADVVNDFRSEYRKKGYSKPGLLVSNLATFNGRQARQSRSRTCVCGSKHSWVKCYYLNPSQRPEGWKENEQRRKKVDEALKNEDIKKKIDAAITKVAASNTEMIEPTLGGMVLLKTSREPTDHSIDHPTDQSSITSDIMPVDRSTRCLNVNVESSPSNQRPYLRDSWIFDTGAERHICNNRSRFLTYEPSEEQIYTGDSTTRVVGYGTVWTYMTNNLGKQFRVILRNAAYIPFSHTNLIAWKPCYHIGGIYLDGKTFRLRRISDNSIFARIEVYGGLLVTEYHRTSENTLVLTNIAPSGKPAEPARISQSEPTKISKSSTTSSYTSKSSTASSKIWHQRLGHPSMRAVEHLPIDAKGVQISDIKDIAKNIDIEDKELCEPCHLAKAKNQISRRPHIRSKLPFERLHADIVQGPSYCYNGERWLIHFVLRWIKRQFDCETKVIRIDNERAIKESDIFKDWVIELGLEIEYSSEYIHEQNGAAERAAYAKIPNEILNRNRSQKLDHRAHIGYLVGYDSTNIFRIWIPHLDRVIRTRDVIFNENRRYNPDEPHIEKQLRDWVVQEVEFLDIEVQEPRVGTPQQENNLCSDIDIFRPDEIPPRTENVDKDNEDINEALEAQLMADILPTPDPTPEPDSNTAIEPDLPIDTHPILSHNRAPRANEISSDFNESNIIEAVSLAKENQNRMINAAFAEPLSRSEPFKIHRSQLPDPPQHWNDVNKHPYRDEWINAAKWEWDSITQQNTYEIVNRPSKDTPVIPLRWVFIYKFDDDGYLTKFKARICVRGDLQPVSDLDTKAHTLAARTFRILLAIINAFDLDAEQLDGVNAFVNSSLDELVYVELPDGWWKLKGVWNLKKNTYVLRLRRALYGLRRSPLLWLKELSNTLKRLGFVPIPEDKCLFTNGRIIIFFYVDDTVVVSHPDDREEKDQLIKDLKNTYEFRQMGNLEWFLNMRITRDRSSKKLWLCQDAYIDKLVDTYHLAHARKASTPLSSIPLAPYQGTASPEDTHYYQRRIGSCIYAAVMTRPDIAYAVGKLATYMTNPSERHSAEIALSPICEIRRI
ncbi:predicted protein [Histoplasma mississippiense (nom. inval.)]|uniref:predicted protein n=1 Tax=Ajellomyces capsulatus (strain NAm1 / WU24) TaxID=2059318 RepID=UPI000157C862|nr:predicted protein [Histoplasma mississippiense (nom. inval.)]EDN09852.1 predicted protein [Histoplasma mississippiense (nom. inval.)]